MKIRAVITLVCIGILGACGRSSADVAPRPTRYVTDDLGRTVAVPVRITRVVSTAPSVTENVFAAGAGDRLVGVTTFCDFPEQAKSIEKIGDTMTPNMETIVALKPDVVLVSTASQIESFSKTLAANGIAVYVSNPATLDEVFEGLKRLGELFGTQEQVAELLPELQGRVASVREKVKDAPRLRVFVQISREPLFTVGRDSFVNSLVDSAGGESITRDVPTAYPKLSKERAAALQPEVIILSESEDNEMPNEVFRNSPALRTGRIYKVNADLIARPGPRLVEAIEQTAMALHPDKFRND